MAQRHAAVADDHLERFDRLSKRYAMRLPSVAERLGERFVQPLVIDRLCALVRPAIEEVHGEGPSRALERLEQEVAQFTREPSGVGFEVPAWLEALEDEVGRVRSYVPEEHEPEGPPSHIRQVRLSRRQIERQLESWEEQA